MLKLILDFLEKHFPEILTAAGGAVSSAATYFHQKQKRKKDIDDLQSESITQLEKKTKEIETLRQDVDDLSRGLAEIKQVTSATHELVLSVVTDRNKGRKASDMRDLIADKIESIKKGMKLTGIMAGIATSVGDELSRTLGDLYLIELKDIDADVVEKKVRERLSLVRYQFSHSQFSDTLTSESFSKTKDVLDYELAKLTSVLKNMQAYNGSGERVLKQTILRFVDDFVSKSVIIFKEGAVNGHNRK